MALLTRALLFLALAMAAACSLQTTEIRRCSGDRECAETFGAGSQCQSGYCSVPDERVRCSSNTDCAGLQVFSTCEDSFCRRVDVPPRCALTYPADFFTNAASRQGRVVIGSVVSFLENAEERRSMEAVFRRVEERNGIEDQRFALVSCNHDPGGRAGGVDTLTERQAAQVTASFLTDTLRVPAILGPLNSDAAESVIEATRARGTVVVTPGAGSPSLALLARDGDAALTDNRPGRFWRAVPDDRVQVDALWSELSDAGITKLAIVMQESSYARDIERVMRERAPAGVEILATRFFPATGANVAARIADAARAVGDEAATVGVLFLSASAADAITFLESAGGQRRFRPQRIFLTDTAHRSFFVTEAGDAAAGLFPRVWGTRLAPPERSRLLDEYVAAYATFFPNTPDPSRAPLAARSWDAAWLVLYGGLHVLVRGDEWTPRAIAQGMRRVTRPDAAPLSIGLGDYAEARRRLVAEQPVVFRGASGLLAFAPEVQELAADEVRVEIWRPSAGEGCSGELPCFLTERVLVTPAP